MIRRLGLFVLAFSSFSLPLRAVPTIDTVGTSAGQFLKLGAGARAVSMGEAYTAATEGADAIADALPRRSRLPGGRPARLRPRRAFSEGTIRPNAAVGTEFRKPLSEELWFAGRLGFNSRTLSDITGLNAISAGMGLSWENYAFDFAWVPYGAVGTTYRFSLSAKFGRKGS